MTMLTAVRAQLHTAARRLTRACSHRRRSTVARASVSLVALAAASAGLVGCGGIPSNAVAQVNGTAITTAAFEHWMHIAGAGTSDASEAALPQPPEYTACIAALAASAPKPTKSVKAPSHGQLKAQCAREYESLKMSTLGYLISADWLIDEANAQHVVVSDKQVHARLASIARQDFPGKGAFASFLHSSPYTVSDLLLRIKLEMLSERLEHKALGHAAKVTQAQIASYYAAHRSRFAHQPLSKVSASIGEELRSQSQERAFATFKTAFRKRWTARTDCRPGYVVLECKQYKASGAKR
jgi:foldase protein PrsA